MEELELKERERWKKTLSLDWALVKEIFEELHFFRFL